LVPATVAVHLRELLDLLRDSGEVRAPFLFGDDRAAVLVQGVVGPVLISVHALSPVRRRCRGRGLWVARRRRPSTSSAPSQCVRPMTPVLTSGPGIGTPARCR